MSLFRTERSNKPGQHVLYELYSAGSDPYTGATRLFPGRQTQLSDLGGRQGAVPRLRNGQALSGGEISITAKFA